MWGAVEAHDNSQNNCFPFRVAATGFRTLLFMLFLFSPYTCYIISLIHIIIVTIISLSRFLCTNETLPLMSKLFLLFWSAKIWCFIFSLKS